MAQLGRAARARAGAMAIQVRARQLEGAAFEAAARRARDALGDDVETVLNGPAALAGRLGFSGVHWPQALVPRTLESICAPAFRSAAAHSIATIRRAERAGARAVAFAPVFTPSWKRGRATGVEGLRAAAAATPLPIYALGGITAERIEPCLRSGAYGVAAVSGVIGARQPASAAQRYLEAIESARRKLACSD